MGGSYPLVIVLVNEMYRLLTLCFLWIVTAAEDFYSHKVLDLDGNEVDLEQFRGKATLVVNTASYCGFTESHLRGLTRLHDILGYGGHFSVLAFPCNQFGEQEPGTEEQIQGFYRGTYKAEYPIFGKIDVIGEEAHAAYKNLIAQTLTHPDWNFYKYLV